jgi:ketosteroid isomerase-like protein
MERAQAERLILNTYRARYAGDAPGMVANFHDSATYALNAAPAKVSADFRDVSGTLALITTFTGLMNAYRFENDWKVLKFIHDGDDAVLIWEGTVTAVPTGKSAVFKVCTVVEFKDGKILSVVENTDTATVAAISS